MKNAIINLALLTISVLLFILLGEFGLRITGIQTTKPNPPLIYQTSAHSDISYELKPNISMKAFKKMVTTNSLGFRGDEIDMEKPRIAVIGDSITFGYSLEDDESIPAYLQESLPDYSVINAGVPGYNLSQETGVLREKILPLKPEKIVLVFYWNDLRTQTAILHDDGTLRPPDWNPDAEKCTPITVGILGYLPAKCWLDTNSAIYRAVKKVLSGRDALQRQADQRSVAKHDPDYDPVTDEDLAVYKEELALFSRLIPEDVPVLFVMWPSDFLHSRSRPILREMAEGHGFTVLDFTEHFGNKVETLSYDRIHPSANATKEAAKIITDHLREF